MATIFITGDRSLHPLQALPLVLVTLLKHRNDTVITGDLDGVETAVKLACELTDFPVAGEAPTPPGTDYKYDFMSRWTALADKEVDKVYVIHPDPHSSKIYTTLVSNPKLTDKVELVLPDVIAVDAG